METREQMQARHRREREALAARHQREREADDRMALVLDPRWEALCQSRPEPARRGW